MPDLFNLSPEMQNYFNTLPKNMQESIIQGTAKINSVDDLKMVVESILSSGEDQ